MDKLKIAISSVLINVVVVALVVVVVIWDEELAGLLR